MTESIGNSNLKNKITEDQVVQIALMIGCIFSKRLN